MIIKRVKVRNFRCIKDEGLDCGRLTALVGTNGSGKSSFLRALQCFYSPDAGYGEDDFFDKKTDEPIEIAVVFESLTAEETARFSTYVHGGELTVTKLMSWPKTGTSQRYHGILPRHPGFEPIRQASGAKVQKPLYDSLRQRSEYSDLPPWTNQPDSLAALEAWERVHRDRCETALDKGHFFDFSSSVVGDLKRQTRLVFIPAVEDAADQASETKESALTQLMNLVVRDALRRRPELLALQREFGERSNQVFARAKEEELRSLQDGLTASLSQLASGAEVRLDWMADNELEIPLPRAVVRLVEDGYAAPVPATGHGLQRLLIVTLLQRLAASAAPSARGGGVAGQDTSAPHNEAPAFVLAIEEPELYQHPNRQRTLSRAFRRLVQGDLPGVAGEVQILYSTHSPLFVDIEEFDDVRVLRKTQQPGSAAKATKVSLATLEQVTREMERTWGRAEGSFAVGETREKLKAQMAFEVNEGFFGDAVVLVEGPEDKALIAGYALSREVNLEEHGVSLVACSGKQNLPRPAAVFRKLNIPTYVIWDNDRSRGVSEAGFNRRLLRLHRVMEEDFPAVVTESYAVFEENAEAIVIQEIGQDVYPAIQSSLAHEFEDARPEFLRTNAHFYERVLRKAREQGRETATLAIVLEKILALRT